MYSWQRKRGVMFGQVGQRLVLQVERLPLLSYRCDLQHELLPHALRKVEIGIALPW